MFSELVEEVRLALEGRSKLQQYAGQINLAHQGKLPHKDAVERAAEIKKNADRAAIWTHRKFIEKPKDELHKLRFDRDVYLGRAQAKPALTNRLARPNIPEPTHHDPALAPTVQASTRVTNVNVVRAKKRARTSLGR